MVSQMARMVPALVAAVSVACIIQSSSAFHAPPSMLMRTRGNSRVSVRDGATRDMPSRRKNVLLVSAKVEGKPAGGGGPGLQVRADISRTSQQPPASNGGTQSVTSMGREGYIIIGLCCLCGTISSLDRMAMSVCIVPLSIELGYTETIKGSISSIFSVGYTLALLPLALAQVILSPKYIMATGVATWSFLTLITPISATMGVPYLLATRMGVGAAEAVAVPTIQTFVSRWVPKAQRSRALSLLYSCLQSGTILALLIAPAIVERNGYPGVFQAFGLLGFGWLAFWLPLARDVPLLPTECAMGECSTDELASNTVPAVGSPNSRSPAIVELRNTDVRTSDVADTDQGGIGGAFAIAKQLPWGKFVRSKGLLAATVAHAANNWGLYVSLAWLPTFFTQQYGMDLARSSLYSLLPYAAGAVTSSIAGLSADKLLAGGMDSTRVRKIMQGFGSFGPLTCMLALSYVSSGAVQDTSETAAALFVGSVALGAASSAGFGTSLQDISAKYSGLLYGMTSIVSAITGAAGVFYTGVILDSTHSWSIVFASSAAVYALGGVWYALGYDASPMFEKGSIHADDD